jgi:mono/diheme cytochrome c family protein
MRLRRDFRRALVPAVYLLAAAGCRQQMAAQPSYRPLKPSAFFADGRSARPLVKGTVPMIPGQRYDPDPAFDTGLAAGYSTTPVKAAALVGAPGVPAAGALLTAQQELDRYVNYLPFPRAEMKDMLERGRERFDIYCAVCHGRDGDGKGMIPQRGFTEPPNFHTDKSRGFRHKGYDVPLRKVPVGYVFEVVTRGYGAMPDYAEQVPVRDRWAIISYVRALQLSRHVEVARLPGAERQRLDRQLGPK